MSKFDRDGTALWTREFGTAATDQASGVAVDVSGNAYVAGNTQSATGSHAFLRKVDPTGSELWTRQFGTTGFDPDLGVAVDASGNVYVGGGTEETRTPTGGVRETWALRKFDPSGTELWIR